MSNNINNTKDNAPLPPYILGFARSGEPTAVKQIKSKELGFILELADAYAKKGIARTRTQTEKVIVGPNH